MKIDRSQLNNIANIYRAHEKGAKSLERREPAQEKDQVILSKEAQELQAAAKSRQDVQKLTEDRTKRVNEVKVLIEKGQYHVDSKLVAEKMIESALRKERM